jgi:hypothetical protein
MPFGSFCCRDSQTHRHSETLAFSSPSYRFGRDVSTSERVPESGSLHLVDEWIRSFVSRCCLLFSDSLHFLSHCMYNFSLSCPREHGFLPSSVTGSSPVLLSLLTTCSSLVLCTCQHHKHHCPKRITTSCDPQHDLKQSVIPVKDNKKASSSLISLFHPITSHSTNPPNCLST